MNKLRRILLVGVGLVGAGLGMTAMRAAGDPSASDMSERPAPPALQGSAASRELDRLGTLIREQEEQAYDIAASRFFEDAEDAEGARPGFYLSSVKVLRLAVDADSTNALALYHLGLALARKSYTGFGNWDQDQLQEAISVLERAQARAVGWYARVRAQITRDLERERNNRGTGTPNR